MADISTGLIAIGAGLAFGLSAVGAGLGEKSIGAAAVGAIAEDEKMFGKGLIFTVLPLSEQVPETTYVVSLERLMVGVDVKATVEIVSTRNAAVSP